MNEQHDSNTTEPLYGMYLCPPEGMYTLGNTRLSPLLGIQYTTNFTTTKHKLCIVHLVFIFINL